jgi:hypothetical protein
VLLSRAFVDVKSKGDFMQALTHFGKEQYDINYKDNDRALVEHFYENFATGLQARWPHSP